MDKKEQRRKFLRNSLAIGLGGTAFSLLGATALDSKEGGEKIKVLTTDGKLVEVSASSITPAHVEPAYGEAAREGIPGRKFVMVVDLSKCKNARKCTENCQKGHDLQADQEWMKVLSMKDNEYTDPYWFPKSCYHCDNPPCVKVCPCDATYKRHDGIVLIDTDRCVGCKFCISACPYSARVFNWKLTEEQEHNTAKYSPETSVPQQDGTVGKCDFCPDLSRNGELPHCASGCPMGAIYFGDANEDVVTNGTETVRFRKLLKDKAAFRYKEELIRGYSICHLLRECFLTKED
jgi:Fe-S-cluster-containing dehydrogenase component